MKTIIPTVKGARDFYPKEKGIQNWLYRQLGEISNSFGYQEYDGPFLEKKLIFMQRNQGKSW